MRARSLTTAHLALTSLRQRGYRSIGLIILIASITLIVTGGTLFGYSLINGVSTTEDRLGADLMIVPLGAEKDYEGALLQGKPGTFYLDGSLIDMVGAIEGVKTASPQLYVATFDSAHCAFPVQLIGFDVASDFTISPWLDSSASESPGLGEIVVGYNVRSQVGDSLLLFGSDYRTVGRLDKTGTGFDNSIFFNLDTAKTLLADYKKYDEAEQLPDSNDVASVIAVQTEQGVDNEEFAKTLREELRGMGVSVILSQAIIDGLSKNLSLTIGIMTILLSALWVLAVIVLGIVFSIAVNERKKEFGIFRVLGATRGRLARIIVIEALIIGLIGASLGIALLCLLVFPFNPLIESVLKSEYLLPGAVTTASILIVGYLICAAMGPLAASFSAIKLGRSDAYYVIQEGSS